MGAWARKGASDRRTLTDDQAACLPSKARSPISQQPQAKLPPSAETSRAPCQTWLSSPNPGAPPQTRGISLLTSGLLSPPRTVQRAAIRTCEGDHLGTQVSVARTAAITRQALGLYSAFLKSVCLKMPPGDWSIRRLILSRRSTGHAGRTWSSWPTNRITVPTPSPTSRAMRRMPSPLDRRANAAFTFLAWLCSTVRRPSCFPDCYVGVMTNTRMCAALCERGWRSKAAAGA